MKIRLARERAIDCFQRVNETGIPTLVPDPLKLVHQRSVPITPSIRDQRACARHVEAGKERWFTARIFLESRGVMRGRIPATPVDARFYRVTSKEKVIVADRTGREQRLAFRQRVFEYIDVVCRTREDAE